MWKVVLAVWLLSVLAVPVIIYFTHRMKKKIRFYKTLLVEIIETLCTICLYLEREGRNTHNEALRHMRGHFTVLKDFSEDLRK